MAFARDDRWITDALGTALSGAQVYWLTQPAVTTTDPPSPLAPLFTDSTGVTPLANPQTTDGFGHAYAYLSASDLYTIYVSHPIFGPYPVILPDQSFLGLLLVSNGGETPEGLINGTNTVFALAHAPLQNLAVFVNGLLTTAYTISGNIITFTTAPKEGYTLYALYFW